VPLIDVAQDGSTYFDVHHTANDTLDKIDKQGLDRTAAAYAAIALVVADMEGDLGRVVVASP
jgi:carboxypeptidase Q